MLALQFIQTVQCGGYSVDDSGGVARRFYGIGGISGGGVSC